LATTSAIDVVMPQMGVSVTEGTITKWLKQEGEEIAADEPLLEISTDKVDTEVPSPGDGVVQQILVQEGETVEVGTKLAVIAPAGAEAPAAESEPEPPEPEAEAVPEPATAQAAAETSAASDAPATTPTADEVEEATPAPAEASATTGDDRPGSEHERQDVRIARRRAHRSREQHRPLAGSGNRPGRPRDEEGHP